jgi:hypothetical protein
MKLNRNQQRRLRMTMYTSPYLKLTPTQVEQMTCEFDKVDDMIKQLESRGRNEKYAFLFD